MKHLALFNGIGGFILAAEWMGWENIAYCEINDFCNQITEYYWKNAKQHRDIRETDFSIYRGKCDIITGGFPCQPFSVAGKRRGSRDDRHLWPEMLRAIREVSPQWVVGENVLGITNQEGGVVFEQVCLDLEAEGYEVQPYILPAAGVDAPHRRYRVWFVAHRTNAGAESVPQWEKSNPKDRFATQSGHKRCHRGCGNRQKRSFQNHKKRHTEKNQPKWHRRQRGASEVGEIANAPHTE